jgi:hypothetical protein
MSSKTTVKDVQAPGEASGPTESSSNMKFLNFSFFGGHDLPGSGSNRVLTRNTLSDNGGVVTVQLQ